ncbi:MAG: sulfite exporter TauE/SafE family protein [Ruminococcaceae bacterium]|nr:sulfite exporter TauE/SafE family protein [Oscillospiraceae bacterium]
MEAIVGFVTGVIASMGLGGGFVLMIWLTVFAGIEQRAAQGINLLFFLPIALLSLIIHIKGGLIDKTLVKKYLLGGIVGAVLGTLASHIVPNELLSKLFSLFLLAFGLRELFVSGKQNAEKDREHNS